MAHKLSVQLRASEDRVQQLESEVEHLESRARRAEGWLQAIKQEIEDKLLGPIEARRPSCRRCIKLNPTALGLRPTLRIVHFGENPARQTLTQFNPHVVRAS